MWSRRLQRIQIRRYERSQLITASLKCEADIF